MGGIQLQIKNNQLIIKNRFFNSSIKYTFHAKGFITQNFVQKKKKQLTIISKYSAPIYCFGEDIVGSSAALILVGGNRSFISKKT